MYRDLTNTRISLLFKPSFNFMGTKTLSLFNTDLYIRFFRKALLSPGLGTEFIYLQSKQSSFFYPNFKPGITVQPRELVNLSLFGFKALSFTDNPFFWDNSYGNFVEIEDIGFLIQLGIYLAPPPPAHVLRIYVKNEEKKPLIPSLKESPFLGLKLKKKGLFERVNAKPDTYKLFFEHSGYEPKEIEIYPEDLQELLKEIEVVLLKEKPRINEVDKEQEEKFPSRTHFVFYFDKAKTEIKELYKDTLRVLSEEIFNSTVPVSVEVHGNASPEGLIEFNQKLSLWRANRVASAIFMYFPLEFNLDINIISDYNPAIKPEDVEEEKWPLYRKAEVFIKPVSDRFRK